MTIQYVVDIIMHKLDFLELMPVFGKHSTSTAHMFTYTTHELAAAEQTQQHSL